MATEIEGKVIGIGKEKQYGDNIKFFLLVEDDEGIEHKAMVLVGVWYDDGNHEYIPGRDKPSIGDRVCYTTHTEKNGWGSVTKKQKWEILERGEEFLADELERQNEGIGETEAKPDSRSGMYPHRDPYRTLR